MSQMAYQHQWVFISVLVTHFGMKLDAKNCFIICASFRQQVLEASEALVPASPVSSVHIPFAVRENPFQIQPRQLLENFQFALKSSTTFHR
jgi:hypothetical protein